MAGRQAGTICVKGRQRRKTREKRRRRDGTGGGRENSNCGVSAIKYLTLLVNKVRTRVTDSPQNAPLIPTAWENTHFWVNQSRTAGHSGSMFMDAGLVLFLSTCLIRP